ncbi:hypothetical protein GCM10022198_01510 [Klugiella xanthotipulae]|uniref:SURF1-like protein n=1 Tax=Klugiella xanthotipulae TaxID=244735 RepID=A0A543I533_9MICO|nr:SURF1 family protein [Klugiella xanthotipulae]TQM65712.1 cytochrome oxidase assembly protein ShyY1 [Klugiella xanthotipulae]
MRGQNESGSPTISTSLPTLRRVLLRPKWIGALLLAIAVAGGFAWLANWQLESAITNQVVEDDLAEKVVPLTELTEPGIPVAEAVGGRTAWVEGEFVPADFSVVGNRVNGGKNGYWVVGHLLVPAGGETAHVAVALGWTPTEEAAEVVRDRLREAPATTERVNGRYQPPEGPAVPDQEGGDPSAVLSMAPAQLANLWESVDGAVYNGFLVSHDQLEGLQLIDSGPPLPQESINWLNLFYAVEWVVFGGFAIYFWYRLARDGWERECELIRVAEEETARAPGDPQPVD